MVDGVQKCAYNKTNADGDRWQACGLLSEDGNWTRGPLPCGLMKGECYCQGSATVGPPGKRKR